MELVDIHAIETATKAVADTCLRTPVLPLAAKDGRGSLWVKAECLQPTGAFKLRGASNAIGGLTDEQRAAGVVTHSSGNHGQAVAFAATAAGVRATVVMPEGAAQVKVDATRQWGAEIVMVPIDERASTCAAIAERTGAEIVPPFDDLRIIAGQGTVGLEIVDQVPDLATVLVPVGGGGLISGVAAAVKARRPDVRVIGVEPELAGDLAEGFAAGSKVSWSTDRTARTVADGLRGASVGDLNWAHIEQYVDGVVTVSEDAIRAAMREIATRARVVAEPSGAVAAAAYVERSADLPGGTTVAIVSGGNVDPAVLAGVLG
ncbi:threonine ammonia-lyase [Solicola gregarius]|uniref:threonine ammonia-lyase n=1 Tax=Solicola gregarius TaxID=2908642 RepID=A0AA46TKD5_9ACTN|nr:threonine/serine dehydratase [Solicola gregarius]UYM06922.1 threonine/serine dehydratase [Solicola gregarius]